MARAPIPTVAAAIAAAELDPKGENWESPAELWAEMSEHDRAEYRRMAKAAIEAINNHTAPA